MPDDPAGELAREVVEEQRRLVRSGFTRGVLDAARAALVERYEEFMRRRIERQTRVLREARAREPVPARPSPGLPAAAERVVVDEGPAERLTRVLAWIMHECSGGMGLRARPVRLMNRSG